jgi:hypothetical protein
MVEVVVTDLWCHQHFFSFILAYLAKFTAGRLCTIQISWNRIINYGYVGIRKEIAWNISNELSLHLYGQTLEDYELISGQTLIQQTSEHHVANHRVQILGKPLLSVCENGNILKIQVWRNWKRTCALVQLCLHPRVNRHPKLLDIYLIMSCCDKYQVRSSKPGHLDVTRGRNENPPLTVLTPWSPVVALCTTRSY